MVSTDKLRANFQFELLKKAISHAKRANQSSLEAFDGTYIQYIMIVYCFIRLGLFPTFNYEVEAIGFQILETNFSEVIRLAKYETLTEIKLVMKYCTTKDGCLTKSH